MLKLECEKRRICMKKFTTLAVMALLAIVCSGCTKQVVFLDRNLQQTKADFDKYIKSTGYEYKLKDDVNNIYNVHLYQYNMQYLLQSKPMISQDYGFTCKFKALGNDTLMSCKTYPSNLSALTDVKRHLKEQKFDDIQFVSYKKYLKMKANGEL